MKAEGRLPFKKYTCEGRKETCSLKSTYHASSSICTFARHFCHLKLSSLSFSHLIRIHSQLHSHRQVFYLLCLSVSVRIIVPTTEFLRGLDLFICVTYLANMCQYSKRKENITYFVVVAIIIVCHHHHHYHHYPLIFTSLWKPSLMQGISYFFLNNTLCRSFS